MYYMVRVYDAVNYYIQCPNTPCLFKHLARDIMFCLVVNDFGIKYGTQDDPTTLSPLSSLTIS
jgi:hypothetical protein